MLGSLSSPSDCPAAGCVRLVNHLLRAEVVTWELRRRAEVGESWVAKSVGCGLASAIARSSSPIRRCNQPALASAPHAAAPPTRT
jgi:hypothetical protein